MLRAGDMLSDKYRILTLIGKGGMSKVWLAMDTKLNKQWAVKEINKHSEEYKRTVNEDKTLSEIEIMKRLDHPSLPRIVDVIDTPSTIYVIMDYIEGETLLNVLKAYGAQDEDIVAGWMLEVCDTLEYLHSQNPPIIYRDMKPSNIMLSQEGKIKIIDFGIAREYKGDKNDTQPLGTRGYASPEHFTKKTDARSDVYTVGVTMYQLLTNKDPSDPPYEILPLREVNPSLSSGLEKIITKATMPNPEDRYQTISEMADAIQSYKKLDENYIASVKKDILRYRVGIIASAAVMLIGIMLFVGGNVRDANTYDKLINNVTPNTEKRISNLEKATDLRPTDETAYLEIIKSMSEDGKFTEEENSSFTEIYNRHKNDINSNTRTGTEINYAIGENILKYYTGETDNSSRAKLLAASPYFNECKDENNENYALAQNYVYLADYYKNQVLTDDSLVAEDTSKKSYQKLLDNASQAVENVSKLENDDNGKMRFVTYEVVAGLLDSKRNAIADKGVEKEELTEIIDYMLEDTDRITPDSENMAERKRTVENEIKTLKENVEFTYRNKNKK